MPRRAIRVSSPNGARIAYPMSCLSHRACKHSHIRQSDIHIIPQNRISEKSKFRGIPFTGPMAQCPIGAPLEAGQIIRAQRQLRGVIVLFTRSLGFHKTTDDYCCKIPAIAVTSLIVRGIISCAVIHYSYSINCFRH